LPPPPVAAVQRAQGEHWTPDWPHAAFCDPSAHVETPRQHPVQLDGPQLGCGRMHAPPLHASEPSHAKHASPFVPHAPFVSVVMQLPSRLQHPGQVGPPGVAVLHDSCEMGTSAEDESTGSEPSKPGAMAPSVSAPSSTPPSVVLVCTRLPQAASAKASATAPLQCINSMMRNRAEAVERRRALPCDGTAAGPPRCSPSSAYCKPRRPATSGVSWASGRMGSDWLDLPRRRPKKKSAGTNRSSARVVSAAPAAEASWM